MVDRVVWDSDGGRTYLAGAGRKPRVVSGAVGALLGRLREGDELARREYPEATAALESGGWLAPDVVFRKTRPGPHLRRVQIEVSLRCNLSCSYCYSMSGPGRKQAMSSDLIRSLVEQADAMGVVTIDFTGGELLLDREWRSYVDIAWAAGMDITIHTNGTTITADDVRFFQDRHVSAVQVSLDSHVEEVHDAARGHRGALRRTLRGLDLLTEASVPVRLSLMAHADNVDSLGETIEYMAGRYPKAMLNVDRVVATGGALACDNGLTARRFWQFLTPYLSGNVRAGRVCESPALSDFEPECGVAYSFVYITADGEIASCPTMTSRENPDFQGPDARISTLSEAWYDSAFFNGFRYTNCENVTSCVAGQFCGGGCRSNAYVETGSLTAPDVVACNTNKNRTKVFVDFPTRYARGDFAVVDR
ncbi:radical SAM protein [Stackebrandtia soli]|uniref:radical SAM protein n=1 Tax=Stackebrandtia soli TaxID=1892856 RepID=UPI0039E8104C